MWRRSLSRTHKSTRSADGSARENSNTSRHLAEFWMIGVSLCRPLGHCDAIEMLPQFSFRDVTEERQRSRLLDDYG